jgi:hypothetical protein
MPDAKYKVPFVSAHEAAELSHGTYTKRTTFFEEYALNTINTDTHYIYVP